MKLPDLVGRGVAPEPWTEGEKIPWHEPDFSRRMLGEHLSQHHDAASRRLATIERHVDWVHRTLLSGRPTRILELGCGPGLYTSRFAKRGHECVGIDYSPASIAYATEQAEREQLRCSYREQDLRAADFGGGFGLVMLIFGELNAFPPGDARAILEKAHSALADRGLLLLEPHTFSAVKRMGERLPAWYSAPSGLFSDRPHLCLQESFWNPELRVATRRYFVIDADTNEVSRHAESAQAYRDAEYHTLLRECGFDDFVTHPSLLGEVDETQRDLVVLVARKRGANAAC
jgi:SAM-dependent methyltransferase